MKKLLYTALAALSFCLVQQTYALTWDDLDQRTLQNMQRQLSTTTNATAFNNTLRGFYTTYGDPNDSSNEYVTDTFLPNAIRRWNAFFRSSGTFPSFSRVMPARTPAIPTGPTAPVTPPVIPPAIVAAGIPTLATPVWNGRAFVITSGTGTVLATFNSTTNQWDPAPGLTTTPAGTPAANISHDGTNYVQRTNSGSLLATWNGTDWVAAPGMGGASSTSTSSTLAPAGTIPVPPAPPLWVPSGSGIPGDGTLVAPGGPAAGPVLTFAKLTADAAKIKPQEDTLQKFWQNLSGLTSEVLCKFNVPKTTLITELNTLPTPPLALINKINALPETQIESKKAAHKAVLTDLVATAPAIYFNLATGAIAKMIQALYQTSRATGDFDTDPNIQLFITDMSNFVTQNPEAYTIKSISTYTDCVDRIPDGDFRTTFRATLKKSLELAKTIKFAKQNPIDISSLAPLQTTATNSFTALTNEIKTAQVELRTGRINDTDAVARVKPLYDAAKTASDALQTETTRLFGAQRKTITDAITATGATPPAFSPIAALTTATTDLATQLATYKSAQPTPTNPTGPNPTGPVMPGPTNPTGPIIVTTQLGAPGSQFPLEAPKDHTGNIPFARTSSSSAIFPNSLSKSVRTGILRVAYNTSPSSKIALINNAKGYDLFIYGPAVADYTKDVCIDKDIVGQNIAIRFQNFNGTTSTKLYKMASKSKAEILAIGAMPAINLATATKDNLEVKINYLYQALLRQEDYAAIQALP